MSNLEEAIRQRAYHLWIEDGQPEGKADSYWLSAQHEILTTSLQSSGLSTTADSVPATTKPLKKPKSALSGKRRTKVA
jgi:DUF2934 family protein